MAYTEMLLGDKETVALSTKSQYEIPYLTTKEFFRFLQLRQKIAIVKEIKELIEKSLDKKFQRWKLTIQFHQEVNSIVKHLTRLHGKHSRSWKRDLLNYCRQLPNLGNLIERIHAVNTQAMDGFFFQLIHLDPIKPHQSVAGSGSLSSNQLDALHKIYKERFG